MSPSTKPTKKKDFQLPLNGLLRQSTQSNLTLFHAIDHEIVQMEQTVLTEIELEKSFEILKTIKGIGNILGMTPILHQTKLDRVLARISNQIDEYSHVL